MQNLKNLLITDAGLTLWGKILVSLFVVLLVILITRGISAGVRRFVWKKKGGIQNQKTNTVIAVLSNVITVIVAFWGFMYILEVFGVNTGHIIATAGIGGIAIGFGAQSLVKDIITGIFLLLGDQFVLGDYIRAGGAEGYVTDLNLRMTTVKAFNGEVTHIPNGSITTVTNISREPMRALAEIYVPYTIEPERMMEKMQAALQEHIASSDWYTKEPEVLGISGNTDFHYILTVVGHTKPMQQWAAERFYRSAANRIIQELQDEEEQHGTATTL